MSNDAARLNAHAFQDPAQCAVSNDGTPARQLPKIFLVSEGRAPWVGGHALAEDGTWLVSHISSSKAFARSDLQTPRYLAVYAAHYLDGYELIDYVSDSGERLRGRADYMAAVMRGEIPDDIRAQENAA